MGFTKTIKLLDNHTGGDSSAPSGGAAGVSVRGLRDETGELPEFITIALRAQRSGGAATAEFRLWALFPGVGDLWCPVGNGTDANKGKLNEGAAIGEVTSQELRHAQLMRMPEHAERLFLQVLNSTNLGATDAVAVAKKGRV